MTSQTMYCSTRGAAPALSFEEALFAGLAPDGGLYMPQAWPRISDDTIRSFAHMSFADVAVQVLAPFVGNSFEQGELRTLCERAYSSFSDPRIAPLVQIDEEDWILELFHGPTLAFKDVAMQLLAGMFETLLQRRAHTITIIGATSGDTGGSAIEALKDRHGVRVFILHPEGRISDVQRRIMTTSGASNIFNIAVDGTFDDCQAIVKTLFADRDFARQVCLGAINSINWARIAIQTVYYFTAAAALGSPERRVSFVVPTGNFGDIFAGYGAMQMGLPIHRLCAATNRNDSVHRILATGEYRAAPVSPTTSPSMDIQVSSNFERLLFEATGRDSGQVRTLMESQARAGQFHLAPQPREYIAEIFCSGMATEEQTAGAMKEHLDRHDMLIDPHTAVGRVVAQKLRRQGKISGPVVTLATAHPAKFPQSVSAATGRTPPLPASLHDLHERTEELTKCPAHPEAVKAFILDNTHPRPKP